MIFKMIGIVLLVLFCLFILTMFVFTRIAAVNKKWLPSKEEVVEGTNGRKALILYQPSKHGAVNEVTEIVTRELRDAGYTVIRNCATREKTYDVAEFDVIALGTAVYMGITSEPINKLLKEQSFEQQNVIVYVVGGNAEVAPELEAIKARVQGTDRIATIKVIKGEAEKLASFVKESL